MEPMCRNCNGTGDAIHPDFPGCSECGGKGVVVFDDFETEQDCFDKCEAAYSYAFQDRLAGQPIPVVAGLNDPDKKVRIGAAIISYQLYLDGRRIEYLQYLRDREEVETDKLVLFYLDLNQWFIESMEKHHANNVE